MFFYIINTTFTRTYTIQYGLSSGIVGICYFPQAVGAMAGGIFGGRYSDNMYRRRVEKEGESWPELRLGGWLMWASIGLQGAAFVAYGWCVRENVHFAWGLVCQFIREYNIFQRNVYNRVCCRSHSNF
jgi:MFS family permease